LIIVFSEVGAQTGIASFCLRSASRQDGNAGWVPPLRPKNHLLPLGSEWFLYLQALAGLELYCRESW